MKKILSLTISLIILFLIYQKMDTTRFSIVLARSDKLWLCISILMVIPITMLTVARFRIIAPPDARVSFAEGMRLILAGSTLNMILPSKMGDLAKAYFMQKKKSVAAPLAYALVVFEKASDLLALLAWCLVGLLLYAGKDGRFLLATLVIGMTLAAGLSMLSSRRLSRFGFSLFLKFSFGNFQKLLYRFQSTWEEVVLYAMGNKLTALRIAATSLFIWFLHLLQIWLFIISLRAHAPFLTSLMLSPLAILAGLLPFTFAGIGTRDAALITLYLPYFDKPTGAALGILCTMRYIIPALLGLPFLRTYTSDMGDVFGNRNI